MRYTIRADHYLVADKLRTRITEVFANQLYTLLAESLPLLDDIKLHWNSLSQCIFSIFLANIAICVIIGMSRAAERHLQQNRFL